MDFTDREKDIVNAFIEDTVALDTLNGVSDRESRFKLTILNDAEFSQALMLYLNKRKDNNTQAINDMAALIQRNTDALNQDNLNLDQLVTKITNKPPAKP